MKRGIIPFVIALCAASAAFSQGPPSRAAGARRAPAEQVTYEQGPPPAVLLPKVNLHPAVLL